MKFTHTNQYNYTTLKRVQLPQGRFYQSPTTNLWYPSITTVTGHSKKAFFKEWNKIPGNMEIKKAAGSRGDKIHDLAEKYLTNKPIDNTLLTTKEVELFQRIEPELNNIQNIQLQEQTIWSDTMKIAGRVDCIAEYNGVLSVIDFKTSLKQKKKEWITDYFEQATGYSIMFQERTGIKIGKIVIIITCEDGMLQVFEENPINYVKSLYNTTKNYFNDNNFDYIQTLIGDIES